MGVIKVVVEGSLARSCRPGYVDEGPATRKEDVESWIAEAKGLGIRGIICLLDEELDWYEDLELHKEGLLGYYRQNGFQVCHIPVPDGQNPPVAEADLKLALRAFDKLPRPVLVHCKAGVDRTGAVVKHITSNRLSG